MVTKKLALASLVVALFAAGCGAPEEESTSSCAPLTRQIVCPPGFPSGQHVCQDSTGAPVSGCELSPGIVCASSCQR